MADEVHRVETERVKNIAEVVGDRLAAGERKVWLTTAVAGKQWSIDVEPVGQRGEEVDSLDDATAMEEHKRLTLSGFQHFNGLPVNCDHSTFECHVDLPLVAHVLTEPVRTAACSRSMSRTAGMITSMKPSIVRSVSSVVIVPKGSIAMKWLAKPSLARSR